VSRRAESKASRFQGFSVSGFQSRQRHPEGPRFYQRVEGSRVQHNRSTPDPSLRLKSGTGQDDAKLTGMLLLFFK